MIYKVPLREVPRGVAQGHIIITTGGNDHLFVHTKKVAQKTTEIAFYPQHFLGVLNSSICSTSWVLDTDVPTTDLLLRNCTQHTKLFTSRTTTIVGSCLATTPWKPCATICLGQLLFRDAAQLFVCRQLLS